MRTAAGKTDLLDYWATLRRRRWVVYTVVSATILLVLVGSYLTTPLYRATVTLQIERQGPDILTFQDLVRVDHAWTAFAHFYQTQYQLLSSEAVSRLAARRLDLESHPLFQEKTSRPGLLARLKALVPGSGVRTESSPEDIVAAWVRSGIKVKPVINSNLVKVSWVSSDPHLAARVANGVAHAYIQFNIESQYTTTDQAAEFLVNQIGTLKSEIATIEERLQQYSEAKGIVSIDDSSNITMRALSDIAQRRTAAQTLLAEKEAGYRAILQSQPEALPEVLHSNLIADLKREYASYEVQYSEKSRQFKEEWPGMKKLKSKLEQARERLELETREIAGKVTAAAESEYRKALNEVHNLDTLLKQQEEAAQHLKRDAFEYTTLQSEVQRKRETLNILLTRQNEMSLSTRLKDFDTTSGNIRVVDKARAPATHFHPNRKLNLLMGLVLGLGLGVGMAFFLDYLDNSVGSPADVENVVGLPVLAVIPRHDAAPAPLSRTRRRRAKEAAGSVDLVPHRDGRAGASEAYREMRTALLLSNPGESPRLIMITSALPGEGKSATATNLAVVLAQLGRRVLLADTDLRRPRLHKIFGLKNVSGISAYLSGLEDDPGRLVLPTGLKNLDLIPSGPIPPNPSELLNSPRFDRIGRQFLEAGYDHIIYDSPPLLSVADPMIIASVVNGTILVVRANRTPRESLRLGVEKFNQSGTRPLGVVINDQDLESQGYTRYGYYGRYDGKGESTLPESAAEDRATGAGGV